MPHHITKYTVQQNFSEQHFFRNIYNIYFCNLNLEINQVGKCTQLNNSGAFNLLLLLDFQFVNDCFGTALQMARSNGQNLIKTLRMIPNQSIYFNYVYLKNHQDLWEKCRPTRHKMCV